MAHDRRPWQSCIGQGGAGLEGRGAWSRPELAERAGRCGLLRRTFGAMKALGAVVVAVALGLSAWMGSQRANAGLIWTQTQKSSLLLQGGRVRCNASVAPQVQVGHAVRVKFTLHNLSKHSVTVSSGTFSTELLLKAADGTTYDTSKPYQALPGIPPPVPRKLRAGATWHLRTASVPVRWRGPLLLTPECLGKALPVLRVVVTAPMLRPDENTAVGEVVAAAGHLLDHCRPHIPGVAVDGQIDAPSGNAPPMDAQCSISLSWDGNFLVAQALVLTPPGLPGVQVYQPYETLWPITQLLPLASTPPYEAIAWQFVVTRAGAIPVAASSLAATNSSGHSAPSFYWDGTGWKLRGESSCGGTGFAWGGTGPDIEFVSACAG